MRARGAQATDIVVLVVAADDGVMPQTVEAIDHAKAAEVPIVVAINKIDRDERRPQPREAAAVEHGPRPREWGGDTVTVEVSANTGDGVEDLLDNLAVVAEVEDLQARADGRATGVVLESTSTRAVAPSPPSWSSRAPCGSVTRWWPVRLGVGCGR